MIGTYKVVIVLAVFVLGFTIGIAMMDGIHQVQKTSGFCIENKCPPPYSGYENNHCMETRCTIPENATISNTSMSVYAYNFTLTSLPKPWANQSCLQNETGQNPDDLVMHFTCEGYA